MEIYAQSSTGHKHSNQKHRATKPSKKRKTDRMHSKVQALKECNARAQVQGRIRLSCAAVRGLVGTRQGVEFFSARSLPARLVVFNSCRAAIGNKERFRLDWETPSISSPNMFLPLIRVMYPTWILESRGDFAKVG